MDPKAIKASWSMTAEMSSVWDEYVELMSRIAPRSMIRWAL